MGDSHHMIAVALLVFVITLVLVIWQPKQLNVAWSASGGALALLLAGVVSWTDVGTVVSIVWNATLTLIALILISAVLEHNGFFEWAALHIARMSQGTGRFLFVFMIFLGAAVSAFFANDGAILIITPIVISMMTRLNMSEKAAIAFVMASGFIADTASLPLVISNLVNILSADFFAIEFVEYASRMLVPSLVSTIASLVMLVIYYRRSIPATYETALLKHPSEVIRDRRMFRLSWLVLAALLAAYLGSEWIGVSISLVVGTGAVILLLMAKIMPQFRMWQTVKSAPWNVVVFSVGMYVVVFGLHNAGFTEWLGKFIEGIAAHNLFSATVGMGLIAGFLSSVMNNLPTVMFDALAIQGTSTEGMVREALVYANVIGSDIGPKMTPIGSLATLLWLHVLASRKLAIGWGYYFRAGIVLTVPTLLVTLTSLWVWLYMIRILNIGVWAAIVFSLVVYVSFASIGIVFIRQRKKRHDVGTHFSA